VLEQNLTIGERLDPLHDREPRAFAQPIKIMLALGEREVTQIDTVLMQPVENIEQHRRFIWPARAHLIQQSIEARPRSVPVRSSLPWRAWHSASGLRGAVYFWAIDIVVAGRAVIWWMEYPASAIAVA
jgi:hypothetical protein